MKCDNLKAFNGVESDLHEFCEPRLVYSKSEVDSAIDELKREHHRERHEYIDMVAQLNAEINRKEGVGKRWFEQCMEARAENVRLKHALWLLKARYFGILMVYASDLSKVANPAIIHKPNFFENPTARCMEEYQHEAELYDNARIKCIKKAEEYK